jgi:hypothetical protein
VTYMHFTCSETSYCLVGTIAQALAKPVGRRSDRTSVQFNRATLGLTRPALVLTQDTQTRPTAARVLDQLAPPKKPQEER